MISPNSAHEMISFFAKSFKPSYVIHLTKTNIITNFDERLIHDFPTEIINSDEYIGRDVVELVINNEKYAPNFSKVLNEIVTKSGTGICAINTVIKDGPSLQIPSIYILFVIVETKICGGNQIKEIKLFNYIEIAKFLSHIFCENMLEPLNDLTKIYQNKVQEKSIFCAFESLKAVGTFISSAAATKINQQSIADILFPFHNQVKHNVITPRFINEFLRPIGGYVDYDKERMIQQLSYEVLSRVTSKNLIPFNSLDANYIIRLS